MTIEQLLERLVEDGCIETDSLLLVGGETPEAKEKIVPIIVPMGGEDD